MALQLAEAAAELQGGAGEALGLPALLMRAQLALAGGDRPGALALLRGLPEDSLRHQPAVVATVAALQVWTSSCLTVSSYYFVSFPFLFSILTLQHVAG